MPVYLDSELLVHLCATRDWDAAHGAEALRPDSLLDVGFVHLSAPWQVHLPANRLFAGRHDLLALHLNPAEFGAELRWEPGVPGDPESMLFPHLYGALPLCSVVSVRPYRPGHDGQFAPLVPGQAE